MADDLILQLKDLKQDFESLITFSKSSQIELENDSKQYIKQLE